MFSLIGSSGVQATTVPLFKSIKMKIKDLPIGTDLKGIKVNAFGIIGYWWNRSGKTVWLKKEMNDENCFIIHLDSAKNMMEFEVLETEKQLA